MSSSSGRVSARSVGTRRGGLDVPQGISSEDLHGCKGEWVHFNVGGEYFCTTRSTLGQEQSSMLNSIVEDEGALSVSRDEKGRILFDRDPKSFGTILNFLRTGEVLLDKDVSLSALLREAQYFSVHSLADVLEEALQAEEAASSRRVRGVEEVPALPEGERDPDFSREDILKTLVRTVSGTPLRFQGVCLNGLDLSELDLSGINFHLAKMYSINMTSVSLRGSNLSHSHLSNAIIKGADMTGCSLHRADAQGANFSGACMKNVDLSYCILTNACLRNVDLTNANLSYAMLRNADLRDANLTNAILRGAIFQDVNRQGATLAMGGVVSR